MEIGHIFKDIENNLQMKLEEVKKKKMCSQLHGSGTEHLLRLNLCCSYNSNYEPIMWTRTNFIITTRLQ